MYVSTILKLHQQSTASLYSSNVLRYSYPCLIKLNTAEIIPLRSIRPHSSIIKSPTSFIDVRDSILSTAINLFSFYCKIFFFSSSTFSIDSPVPLATNSSLIPSLRKLTASSSLAPSLAELSMLALS